MENMYCMYSETFCPEKKFDVIKIARKALSCDTADLQAVDKRTGKLKASYTLEKVFHHFCPDEDPKFHSSIEDVRATGTVFRELVRFMKKLLDENEKAKHIEEEFVAPVGKPLAIMNMWLFNPSHRINRVYIITNYGKFFYDSVKDTWNGVEGSGNLKNISVEDLRQKAFSKVGATNNTQFHKYFIDLEKKRKKQEKEREKEKEN
jgi:hypothetical protein